MHLDKLKLQICSSVVAPSITCPPRVSDLKLIGELPMFGDDGDGSDDGDVGWVLRRISVRFDEGCLQMKDMGLYRVYIPAPFDLTRCSNLVVVNLLRCDASGWESLALPHSTRHLVMYRVGNISSIICGSNMRHIYLAGCGSLKRVCLLRSDGLQFIECDRLQQLERVTMPQARRTRNRFVYDAAPTLPDNVANELKPSLFTRGGGWCSSPRYPPDKPQNQFLPITDHTSFMQHLDADRILDVMGRPGSTSFEELFRIRRRRMEMYAYWDHAKGRGKGQPQQNFNPLVSREGRIVNGRRETGYSPPVSPEQRWCSIDLDVELEDEPYEFTMDDIMGDDPEMSD